MTDDTVPDGYRTPDWLGWQPGAPFVPYTESSGTAQARTCVTINITYGTPVTGLWCATCLLPSRYTVPLYVLGDDGPYEVGTVDRCDRCSR